MRRWLNPVKVLHCIIHGHSFWPYFYVDVCAICGLIVQHPETPTGVTNRHPRHAIRRGPGRSDSVR